MFHRGASQSQLVWLGRGMTVLFVLIGCLTAPMLDDPRFGGVFQYIQQFQGYIWPGVAAAFVIALVVPRAPAAAGVFALVAGPALYGIFQAYSSLHFLIQVALTFAILCVAMLAISLVAPLPEPRVLPARGEVKLNNSRPALLCGGLVIAGVLVFVIAFW
jgi:SSS family solute:Na+ symporter